MFFVKDKPANRKFALCLNNGGNDDLIPRKSYEVLPDPRAATDGLLRVIGESGEDYLYPKHLFTFVELPPKTKLALVAAA
jgi:hypothetical protein